MPSVNLASLRSHKAHIKKQKLNKINAKSAKIKKSKPDDVKIPAPRACELHVLAKVNPATNSRLYGLAQEMREAQLCPDNSEQSQVVDPVLEQVEASSEENIVQNSPLRRMQFGVPLLTSAEKRHAKQLRRQRRLDAKNAKKAAKRQLKEQQLAERQEVRDARKAAKLAKAQAKKARRHNIPRSEQVNQEQLTQNEVLDQPILLHDGDVIQIHPIETRHVVCQPTIKLQPIEQVSQPQPQPQPQPSQPSVAEEELQSTMTSYFDATSTATTPPAKAKLSRKQRRAKKARARASRAATQALAANPTTENVLHVPTLSRRPSRAELINAESRIGSQIFGPIPVGHRREFFHDQRGVWIWHEDWIDNGRREHNMTVRYEVRPSGVYKKVSAGKYFKLEGNELENFRIATHSYLRMVKSYLYQGAN